MYDIEKLSWRTANALLSVKAVFLRPEEPFTWASGIKSPIYCDNRLVLGYPDVRRTVEEGIALVIRDKYPEAEGVFGTATAGIAHAAIAAWLLGLPAGYVRSAAKDHGRQNRVEGRIYQGMKVVVVEDLISTGGSVTDAVEGLKEAGAEVLGVVSIFSYNMPRGAKKLAAAGVVNTSLTDFDSVLRVASESGYIKAEDVPRLIKFRNDPADESWIKNKE